MSELNEHLAKCCKEVEELRLEIVKYRNNDQLSDCLTKSQQSITNLDDLESVETISISEKVSNRFKINFWKILIITEGVDFSDFDFW